jgi:transposase-like protein
MPQTKAAAEREQMWRRHIDRQRTSGVAIRAYCLDHGLNEHSFYSWRRTIAARDRQSAPAFLPIAVVDGPAQPHDSPIEIRFPDGRCVRILNGCDRALLADVLAILHAAPKPEARPC